MSDTPYGVTGCRCTGSLPDAGAPYPWTINPHCPYHGILPRDRTDTGVYRVVVTGTGADTGTTIGTPEHPVWPGAVDALNAVFQTNGQHLEPDLPMTPAEMTAALAPDSLDDRLRRGIEQAERGETVDRGDFTPDCEACQQYGECLDCQQAREDREERVRVAAERVARVSEGLNQRLAEGPRCKGAGYCVYHDVPTVHDTGPIVAQKKPADCDADGCNYQEPHKHGFACDKTCDVCCIDTAADDTPADVCDTPCWLVETPDTKPGSVEWFAEERHRRDAARTATAKHLASGALRPALTATEEKYYWLIHKPAWWRRLFRR